MTSILIEDELPAARALQRKLEQLGYMPQIILQSVEEAIDWLQRNPHPELIFMDIHLADGLSFEILEQVKPSSSIIFTTAYDHYMLRAFKENSIDYLLKPIQLADLEFALQKFEKNQSKQKMVDLSWIKQFITTPVPSYKERFSIKIGSKIKLIDSSSIECFWSENKANYIYTNGGDSYLIDTSIDQLSNQLNPKEFFRINRGAIIQLKAIKEIALHSNTRLKIVLQHFQHSDLIVAREKVAAFKAWIEQ